MDEIILKKKGWPEVTIELVKTCGVSLTAEVESSTGWDPASALSQAPVSPASLGPPCSSNVSCWLPGGEKAQDLREC